MRKPYYKCAAYLNGVRVEEKKFKRFTVKMKGWMDFHLKRDRVVRTVYVPRKIYLG